jgi:imidazoleglycerol-phosphate dehydratase
MSMAAGKSQIDTGVPFFDHMLTLFAKHGLFDLKVKVVGDIEVDYHHTVEDTGIVLGKCFREALATKPASSATASGCCPWTKRSHEVALDLSGRSFARYQAPERVEAIGGRFSYQLVEEFLRAFASCLLATLHVEIRVAATPTTWPKRSSKASHARWMRPRKHDPRVTGIPARRTF